MAKKKLRLLPFISFCCILFSFSVIGSWAFGTSTGQAFFNGISIVGVLSIFPKRSSVIEDYWEKKILDKTHIFFISLAATVSLIMFGYVMKNFSIERKK